MTSTYNGLFVHFKIVTERYLGSSAENVVIRVTVYTSHTRTHKHIHASEIDRERDRERERESKRGPRNRNTYLMHRIADQSVFFELTPFVSSSIQTRDDLKISEIFYQFLTCRMT